MRFRRLDLLRYGGYADRTLDFGEGRPDLHLIVGPNEAGKSTLLSAIADLLFGFPGQSTQNWKFDYGDLRLRGLIEQDGKTVDVTRRKGNRKTLLAPDGAVLDDGVLAPYVGSYDRAAFERMFGLDQAKLRAGGQAILDGRDDVARTLFQAGSGLDAVGVQLKALEGQAASLFKPNASIPTINVLLRRRQESLKRVREATLGELELTQMRRREDEAGARRDELIAEARALNVRANLIERVQRTRAPLARLSAARSQLESIPTAPVLPADVAHVLSQARSERATAVELLAQHQQDLDDAMSHIAGTSLPDALLSERVRIEALDERRPAIEKAQSDMSRRLIEMEGLDNRIAAGRANAGLAPEVPIPSDSWRRRSSRHLEAFRAWQTRAANLVSDKAAQMRDLEDFTAKLACTPDVTDLADLRTAAAGMPGDAEVRLRNARAAAAKTLAQAETGRISLSWSTSASALTQATLPSVAEVAMIVAIAQRAHDERRQSLKEAETAERDLAGQQRRIRQLSAGHALPTPDAIRAARAARDATLSDVRGRLSAPRRDDDATAGERLAEHISQVDGLVDRRDADAKRVAEHAIACAALEEATARLDIARASANRWLDEIRDTEAQWTDRLAQAGLPERLAPVGFEAWRADRERVVRDFDTAAEAGAMLDGLQIDLEQKHARLGMALSGLSASVPNAYADRLREAQAVLSNGEQAALARAGLMARQAALDRLTLALNRETEAVSALGETLLATEGALCRDGGVPASAGALAQALEELDAIAADVVARGGLKRQIDGMRNDVRLFGEEVAVLFAAIGRHTDRAAPDAIRSLAHELKAALESHAAVERSRSAAGRAATAGGAAQRRLAAAQKRIDDILMAANVGAEAELDPVIAAAAAADLARARRDEAMRELTDAGDGHPIEILLAENQMLSPDEAAGEREAQAARRREIESEREAVGGALSQAQNDLERTAGDSAAALAQQETIDTQAALAAASERYVATSTSAALLRWLIDRYRASSQAPMLARAGDLFRRVTGGAYTRLLIDFDDDDQARILALRADHRRVGVEGLSEGTRDQLYLALRLAALQERRDGSPLPLICDDLLATSDLDRAGRMLEVLSTTAETMQVLVFSHHDHIVDVARQALGDTGFRLHRLPSVADRHLGAHLVTGA